MKIVLNPLGSHGDVHPFIGYGIELARRGHEVVVVTNEHFGPLACAAGLGFIKLGDEAFFRMLRDDPNLWHKTRAPEFIFSKGVFPMIPRAVATLREQIVPGQTVLVSGSLGLAARLVQDLTGVPHATVHLSPLAFRSLIAPPKVPGMVMPPTKLLRKWTYSFGDAVVVDRIITRPLNAERKALGLSPVNRILWDWWHSPTRVIGAFPDWFAPRQVDWPAQVVLTGFPLYDERDVTPVSPDVDNFLNTGDTPIAFTPGSAMVHGRDFFTAAAGACVNLNRRGILLTRHGEQIPTDLPKGVIHVGYAPFSQLLPRCAAIVHHGGIGTTAQGLAAGVPQVVMPMAHDQPDNAARLVRLGVGATLLPKKFTTDNLAKALGTLLADPSTLPRAKSLATKLHQVDAIAATADAIEAMAHVRS